MSGSTVVDHASIPGGEVAFTDVELRLAGRQSGKVRVAYRLANGRRLLVTTDRLSAFDRVLAAVPYKGQVLNELSAWWFEQTSDVIANHALAVPDPNVLVAIDAAPLPVEVVVRARLTGSTSTSLLRRYEAGERDLYGYRFPDGLARHQELAEPIVTPTTKAHTGGHDEPIAAADVVASQLVDAATWDRVVEAALELFRRGQRVGQAAGLVLADTKYEFGLTADGALIVIDEIHTPDSSRWWVAASLGARLAAGEEPESLDKEPFRLALGALGYCGDGPTPALGPDVISATEARYVLAYEQITGRRFERAPYPVGPRIERNLEKAGLL